MKYFGTDGIRGRVGDHPITPSFTMHLGWALGSIIIKNKPASKVIIGRDTRKSGYMLEYALQAGLSAAGCEAITVGEIPTPAVAFLTKKLNAQAGIVISASHNPYEDNGIKIFNSNGEKLSQETENQIEILLTKQMSIVPTQKLARSTNYQDANQQYFNYCKSTATNLNLKGFKIVIDAANGACYRIVTELFSNLGANVITIGTDPDGININHKCGSTYPKPLQNMVKSTKADLGIAFDGDGDRVIMVDHTGKLVDGDQLLFIIASHLQQNNLFSGGVVGTVMTNMGIEQAFKANNISLVRTSVGDKYVDKELTKRGWILGGESSGHIICKQLATTGDGIIAALQVLSAMCQQNKTLAELINPVSIYPQILINVQVYKEINLDDNPNITKAITDTQQKMINSGRVLVRKSGTEPVIRVMIEGKNKNIIHNHAQKIARVIEQESLD